MLQMAYSGRDRRPVTMDVGPVLDLEDVVESKVCAGPVGWSLVIRWTRRPLER
jgi:hypothetical protein